MVEINWLDDQIGRFEWHCRTHIINPANVLARSFRDNSPPLNDSGFFILCGVVPYFEGLGQHLLGEDSAKAFESGFKDVYCHTLGSDTENVAVRVKQKIRNGLFHDAAVRGRSELSRNFTVAIRLTQERLELNPYLLVCDLENHLQCYLYKLRDCNPCHNELRRAFEKRRRHFETEYGKLPPVTDATTTTTAAPNDPSWQYGPYDEKGGLKKKY